LFQWEEGKVVVARADGPQFVLGSVVDSASDAFASGFVDVSAYRQLRITITQLGYAQAHMGACFYDADQNVVSAVFTGGNSPRGMIEYILDVPAGARYIRSSKDTREGYGPFYCIGIF
jgi:hypothetical protein